MLTQEQLEKLQPLTLHSKFGKFLEDAVEVWKNANPNQHSYGVGSSYTSEPIMEFDCDSVPDCCLIGAAVLGKNIPLYDENVKMDEWDRTCNKYFGLTREEIHAMIQAFDDGIIMDNHDPEAFEFASQVRKIVFGE